MQSQGNVEDPVDREAPTGRILKSGGFFLSTRVLVVWVVGLLNKGKGKLGLRSQSSHCLERVCCTLPSDKDSHKLIQLDSL